jgi:hypothetical protein
MGFQYACGLASRIHPPPRKISPALPITFRSPPAHTPKDALPSNRTHASHPSNRPSRRARLSRPLRNPLTLQRRPALRQCPRSTRFALHPPHPIRRFPRLADVRLLKNSKLRPRPWLSHLTLASSMPAPSTAISLRKSSPAAADSKATPMLPRKSSSTSPVPPAGPRNGFTWLAHPRQCMTPSASPSARSRFLARTSRSTISRLLTFPLSMSSRSSSCSTIPAAPASQPGS